MKKLLSVILCLILLVSLAGVPARAESENHCQLFSRGINLLRWWSPNNGVAPGEAFDNAIVMRYTAFSMCTDEYGEQLITEGYYSYYASYAIPSAVFEAAAADFFSIIDVEQMRAYTSWFYDVTTKTEVANFRHYQPDRDVYIFGPQGGWGDPSHYDVLGYTQNANGTYSVYSRFVDIYGDERPDGTEGVDYYLSGSEYWIIEHYLKTDVAISNGRVQFHSWQRVDAMPDVEMTKPIKTYVKNENITIEAESDVFPEGAEIKVQIPVDTALQTVTNALDGVADKFVAYDITSTQQPNGTVEVVFTIPEGYAPEDLAVFYIPADGSAAYPLDIQVDAEKGCVTAKLTHFSLYALVQLKREEPTSQPTQPDATEPSVTQPSQDTTPGEGEQPEPKSVLPYVAVGLVAIAALAAAIVVFKRKK